MLGKLIAILGWGCMAWFGLVGGAFTAIYLMGFVGTAGREAGSELALVGGITLAGVAAGWLLKRLGTALSK